MERGADFERWCADEPPARRAVLDGWWSSWLAASSGDDGARAELTARVALDARAAGEAGELASRSIGPWLRVPDRGPESTRLRDELLRTAADAHALGVATRVERAHRVDARNRVPVVALGREVVATFLSGRPDGPTLDVALDRAFRRAVATGARFSVIDVSCVEGADDVLIRTLRGIGGVGLPPALRVVVTGANEALAAALSDPRLEGVEIAPTLARWLEDSAGT